MYRGKLPAAGEMAVIVKPSFCGCRFNIGVVLKVTGVHGPYHPWCRNCGRALLTRLLMFADYESSEGYAGPIEHERLRKLEDPDAGKSVSDVTSRPHKSGGLVPRKQEIVGWDVYAGGRKIAYVDGPSIPRIVVGER